MKSLMRQAINKAGFEITRTGSNIRELQHASMMRTIHCNDACEIEALYRNFVLPGLPARKNRAALLYDLIGTSIGEGLYIVNYLHNSLAVPGDICEFGVAQGATATLMAAEFIQETERKLWLYDSFEGLPKPSKQDRLIDDIFDLGSMAAYEGTMASPETEVLDKLAKIKFPKGRIKLKKGWIKDTFRENEKPGQIAFAYIDLDFYEPVLEALYFVDQRMPIGGHIVVDDYGWFSEGAQIAVNEFWIKTGTRYRLDKPIDCAGHFVILTKQAQENWA